MMKETWVKIPGYDGAYEVSNFGQVRSIDRLVKHVAAKTRLETQALLPGRILSQGLGTNGYLGISLSKNGIVTPFMVHRLVAAVFVDGQGQTINHKDGNKANNSASNLEWCSHRDNALHAYRTGLRPIGKDNHFSKLPRDSRGRCMAAKREIEAIYPIEIETI